MLPLAALAAGDRLWRRPVALAAGAAAGAACGVLAHVRSYRDDSEEVAAYVAHAAESKRRLDLYNQQTARMVERYKRRLAQAGVPPMPWKKEDEEDE